MRNEGLFATAGRPEPEPPAPEAGPLVAIAVGKTKEGESLPAKPNKGKCYYAQEEDAVQAVVPSFEYPVPLHWTVSMQLRCRCAQAARELTCP